MPRKQTKSLANIFPVSLSLAAPSREVGRRLCGSPDCMRIAFSGRELWPPLPALLLPPKLAASLVLRIKPNMGIHTALNFIFPPKSATCKKPVSKLPVSPLYF